jgi:hypothetical protein
VTKLDQLRWFGRAADQTLIDGGRAMKRAQNFPKISKCRVGWPTLAISVDCDGSAGMDALNSADMFLLEAFRFDRRSRSLFHSIAALKSR